MSIVTIGPEGRIMVKAIFGPRVTIVYRVADDLRHTLILPTRLTDGIARWTLDEDGIYRITVRQYAKQHWQTVETHWYRVTNGTIHNASRTDIFGDQSSSKTIVSFDSCGCERTVAFAVLVSLCVAHRAEWAKAHTKTRTDRLAVIDALNALDGTPIAIKPTTLLWGLGYTKNASGCWRTPDQRTIC